MDGDGAAAAAVHARSALVAKCRSFDLWIDKTPRTTNKVVLDDSSSGLNESPLLRVGDSLLVIVCFVDIKEAQRNAR